MIDLHLRASDENELIERLSFARGMDMGDNEIWITDTKDYSIVLIGPLIIEEGDDENSPVIDERFHLNIRCTQQLADWIIQTNEYLIITPENPRYTWL